jgi:hypothetical protein
MKKVLVILAAVTLVVAFTVPAAALDHEFGGYWRTRAYMNKDFDGTGSEANDLSLVDTRTRLYYTAVFSENFKFVNKFEMDAVWGGDEYDGADATLLPDSQYGDIGADGVRVEVKNSYVDFNLSAFNFKIGTQGTALARGFFFDDDFSGLIATYKGETFTAPFIWMKAYEGGEGKDMDDEDLDYYAIAPSFKIGGLSLNPYLILVESSEASTAFDELSLTYIGADLDAKLGDVSWWLTAISESGDSGSDDVSAMLFAIGASMPLGPVGLHAQVIYATGDDDPADTDIENFFVPAGQSYYWSEIMGYGIFDYQASAGAPADQISNLMAYNIGVSFEPMEKVTITADLWNASLREDDAAGNDDLGTEIDLMLSYAILDNLNLDVVAAKLWAGDATGDGSEDPTEIGMQLSFSF